MRRTAPIPAPLRRGAAAVVVTSGALSLAGVAATIPVQLDGAPIEPGVVAAAVVLPAAGATPSSAPDTAGTARLSALVPVDAEIEAAATEQIDTAALVKAVQLAEKDVNGDARPSATPDHAAGDPEQDAADQPVEGADEENADEQGEDDDKPATAGADPTDPAKPSAEADATAEPKAGSTDCGLGTSELGAVKPHVRSAAVFLGCSFGEPTVLGVAGRGGGSSDHPSGKALDFMVDRATGDALANCALRDHDALGVSYVIWRQRINFGSGWKPMEDRGGATANHFDHVHVSFKSGARGRPSSC